MAVLLCMPDMFQLRTRGERGDWDYGQDINEDNYCRHSLEGEVLLRPSNRADDEQIQSTFMIDLQQVSLAVNSATNRSLLIIDEFGKGTDAHGKRSFHQYCLSRLLSHNASNNHRWGWASMWNL